MLPTAAARILMVAALVLSAPDPRAAVVSIDPPQRPGASARPPEYDLGIVKIGPTLRWQGGLAEPAIFDVSILSSGLRDVQQPEVVCEMGGRTFRALGGAPPMRRGEPYQFAVQIRGSEAISITPGPHEAACTARIVRPREAKDGNPANDAVTGTVMVEPAPRPDLAIRTIELRDCETRGTAVKGRPLCAEVSYENSRLGAGIASAWTIACDIAGARATAAGVTPVDKGDLAFSSVRFEGLPAGELTATCTIDPDGHLAETDETNNERTDRVLVLADATEARYDLAIASVGTAVQEAREEQSRQPYLYIEVRLRNLGTQAILQADVRCDLGATGLTFLSSGGWSFQPGEEGPLRVELRGRRLGQIPSGAHEATCVAGIVQPKSVVEVNVENNVLAGVVTVRR
jgi:hypothetical protein